MTVLGFIVLVIIVGLVVWLAVTYVPMPAQFKTALPVIALVLLILILLLYMLGGLGMHDVAVPRLR